jgi:CRP/FNR family cyclic AMP-dependent transcriptional regulator
MKPFKCVFSIVEEKNCPLYKVGEKLVLSEKTLLCPDGKEVCLILVRDMTELLFQLLGEATGADEDNDKKYNCSGCTGLIKFSRLAAENKGDNVKGEGGAAFIDLAVEKVFGKTVHSQFIRILPAGQINTILSHFRKIPLDKGAILIQKGEQNRNIYIVFEGELRVEDDTIFLAALGEGELCGEMSCLGADIAVSTVRAAEKAEVLVIAGDDFDRLLGSNASVQAFLAQLMATRLREINAARVRDFESSMSGRLDEIVPAELFQIFHMHQKTGVLAMELPGGKGKISFREGCLINASYAGEKNQEAIFKILTEKKGVYRFTNGLSPKEMKVAEIGDFMMLLMEGVKRVDEG